MFAHSRVNDTKMIVKMIVETKITLEGKFETNADVLTQFCSLEHALVASDLNQMLAEVAGCQCVIMARRSESKHRRSFRIFAPQ